jgi:hypothetical protein
MCAGEGFPGNGISIKPLILVAINSVFFSIVLDNRGLDHQIVGNDLVRPSVLKELDNCFAHNGTPSFGKKSRRKSAYVFYPFFFCNANA